MDARERRVTGSGNVSLSVREWGDVSAPTVVLVHGYPDNSDVWRHVVPLLSDRFHVVAYDVRGAGKSDAGRMFQGYALEHLVADLKAVIDATVPDGKKVHLVGHDWGAIQGWEALLDDRVAPRVASYTFFGAPCLDHAAWWLRKQVGVDPRKLAALAGQLLSSWYIFAFHAPFLAPTLWRSGLGRVWPTVLRLDGVKPSLVSNGTQAEDGARGVWLYRANFIQKILHPNEGRTEAPVQVITTSGDPFLSPKIATELEARVPNLWRRDLVAGHWAQLSHPGPIARWIGEFADCVESGVEAESLRRARGRRRAARREFESKLVVVTGAGSGIGRETAFAFAKRGADVVVVDLDTAAAERTAEGAREWGGRAHAYQVDVADGRAMEELAARIERECGTPDIVINNAGIGLAGPFLETSASDWNRVLDVNFGGVLHGSRLFAAQMAKRGIGGHIVNVASVAAYLPSRSMSAYCTSKAAVLMLSECMRADLASSNIKVTAICPGVVRTNITQTSRFVGTDTDRQNRLRAKVSRLYALRNFTPDRAAREILRACRDNRAVVPVTAEAKMFEVVGRLSPSTLRWIARWDPLA